MSPDPDPPRFAAFLDLREKRAVVVGAGAVAARRVGSLLRSGARLTVVAPSVGPRVAELVAQGAVVHAAKRFAPEDLAGADIVVAATDDRAVNAAVAAAAHARKILVDVADDPAHSSFIMASVVERLPVQIAVSTGGASPVLARRVAAMIERAVPAGIGRLATLVADFRETVRRRLPDADSRRRFWERVCDGPVAAKALEGDHAEARRLLERELDDVTPGKPP